MIIDLPEEIMFLILWKFHRFKYLYNLCQVNIYLKEKTNNILNYHYNKINIYLNSTNLKKIYKSISNHLFYSKILNTKNLNISYYNHIKTLKISPLIKLLILFNEYNDSNIQLKHFKIINYKELISFIEFSKTDPYYFPFMLIFLKNNFTIFIEYSNDTNSYRLKLRYRNNDISIYKKIAESTILDIFSFTKKKLLDIYL